MIGVGSAELDSSPRVLQDADRRAALVVARRGAGTHLAPLANWEVSELRKAGPGPMR
jgi:hypothetical protein